MVKKNNNKSDSDVDERPKRQTKKPGRYIDVQNQNRLEINKNNETEASQQGNASSSSEHSGEPVNNDIQLMDEMTTKELGNVVKTLLLKCEKLERVNMDLTRRIEALEKDRNKIEDCNNIGKADCKSEATTNNKEGEKVTYASKTKREHILIIKPKEKQEANETRAEIREQIKPADLKISVNSVRDTREGGVVLKYKNESERDKMYEVSRDKLGEKYEIKTPKKDFPESK